MKRLLVFVISLFLLQIVKAAPSSLTDSSRVMKAAGTTQANVLNSRGVTDTIMVPVTEPAPITFYQNNILKKRLDSIQKDIHLDYNEYVQSYIDLYLTPARRNDLGRVLGLAKYYFPIYEKAFREAGVPEEIEYLSIVESQLNPHAVSRVGATGPWQFMSNTAKTFGLTMDGYVDERRDPVQSSAAAAAYLKDAYQEFGDWLLAIASYNCGRSNVIHAIEKANGASDFWSIRQYLPVETRGYVPAYIAITYLMNYHKKYNIVPQTCNFLVKTDTVSVDKFVSINSVAHCLNIDAAKLAILNPAYSQQIIHATKDAPRILIIPEDAKEKYATSYASLNSDLTYYAVVAPKVVYTPQPAPVQVAAQPVQTPTQPVQTLQKQPEVQQQPVATPKATNTVAVIAAQPANKKVTKTYISYRVQPGDTLPVIAQKFEGASVEDIKSLNGLKNEDIQPGMILNISKS